MPYTEDERWQAPPSSSTSSRHNTRNSSKRSELPSPAYSPSAFSNESSANKRQDAHSKTPTFDPLSIRDSNRSATHGTSEEVNDIITSNQRAFAARFGFGRSSSTSDPPPPRKPHRSSSPDSPQTHSYSQGSSSISSNSNSSRSTPSPSLTNSSQASLLSLKAPPVLSNAIGMGGLQSPNQMGIKPASTSTKSSTRRRISCNKKNILTSTGKIKCDTAGGGRWTKEEDSKLRSAVLSVGFSNWKIIATSYMSGTRSETQCLHRWQKVLQPGLVKGPWTKAEDQIILDCISCNILKWSEIAERISGRIGKQCRERWFNHLDPSLRKGGWEEEEDLVLVEGQREWGNCWTKIAKLLPGRSENAVKNRWNSATRKRAKCNEAEELAGRRGDVTASTVLSAARKAAARMVKESDVSRIKKSMGRGEDDEEDEDSMIRISEGDRLKILQKKRELEEDILREEGMYDGEANGNYDYGTATEETSFLDNIADEEDYGDGNDQQEDALASFKQASSGTTPLSSSLPVGGMGLGRAALPAVNFSNSQPLPRMSKLAFTPKSIERPHSASFSSFSSSSSTTNNRDDSPAVRLSSLGGGSGSRSGSGRKKKGSSFSASPTVPSPPQVKSKSQSKSKVATDFSGISGGGMDYLTGAANDDGDDDVDVGDDPDDDPSLSSSLMTMSLDKDILMTELNLSLGDNSVLTRPSINPFLLDLSHEDRANHSNSNLNSNSNSMAMKMSGNESSTPSHKHNPRYTASGFKSASTPPTPKNTNESGIPKLNLSNVGRSTAFDVGVDVNGDPSNVDASSRMREEIDPDLLDGDQSVDLSTDLAKFMGGASNLLWSLGSSSGANGNANNNGHGHGNGNGNHGNNLDLEGSSMIAGSLSPFPVPSKRG